jgi:Zn-dependent peptidase ImmA (M78 family)
MKKKGIHPKVKQVAEGFWRPLLPYRTFPVDIERVIAFSNLPLHIDLIPGLDIEHVNQWIKANHFPARIDKDNCALHGFLLARSGHGIIFVNGTDNRKERRFTIAHELAHFLLDYYLPRIHYLKIYGDSILEILDGSRLPTFQERLTFVISELPSPFFTHLLDNSSITAYERTQVWSTEWRTDALAFEILAPFHVVISSLKKKKLEKRFDPIFRQASSLLATDFGLPSTLASSYAKHFASYLSGGMTLAEEWGIKI